MIFCCYLRLGAPRLAEKEPSGSKIEQAAEFTLSVERLCIQIGIWGYELDKYQVYARFVLIDDYFCASNG